MHRIHDNKWLSSFLVISFITVLLLGWTLALLKLEPKITMAGKIVAKDKPEVKAGTILRGEYQSEFDDYFRDSFPLKNAYIKLYNQTIFQGFDQSPNTSIEIGSDGVLYEKPYLLDYYKLAGLNGNDYYVNMIEKLEYIQNQLEANGKQMFLFITPSKADFMSEYTPTKYQYVGSMAAEERNYDRLLRALEGSGVHYFNCCTYLQNYNPDLSDQLFSKTGIHWNFAAAGIALQGLTNAFNAQYGETILPEISVESVSAPPNGWDLDIFSLMNTIESISLLRYADVEYFHPIITITKEPIRPARTIFIQGGSFQYAIYTALEPIYHGAINRLENKSLTLDQVIYSLNTMDELDIERVLQSDVLLLECNQQAALSVNEKFVDRVVDYIKENGVPQKSVTYDEWNKDMKPYETDTYGLYIAPGYGAWTQQKAGIYLRNALFSTQGITIRFHANLAAVQAVTEAENTATDGLQVTIRINGVVAETINVTQNENEIHISPENFMPSANHEYLIELECNHTFNPSKLPELYGEGYADNRDLGIMLQYVGG